MLVERKVSVGCVMLVGRRKFAYRYVMIGIGCSEDYCGLFTFEICRVKLIANFGYELF